MACRHPLGVKPIRRDGEIVGAYCEICGMSAYRGESVLRGLWRWLRGARGEDA